MENGIKNPSVNLNKLRGTIKEKGLTESALAAKIGITRQQMSRLLNNSTEFTVSITNLIVDALSLNNEEIRDIFFN